MLARRVVANLAARERLERPLLELLHRAPPLQRDQRLDAAVAALAERDAVPVVLALLEQPALLAPREDPLLRLLLREPLEPGRRHEPVRPDATRLRQAVVAADLEVGRVVTRRDLQRARAELALDALVRDHGHARLRPRDDHLAADERAVAIVLRM